MDEGDVELGGIKVQIGHVVEVEQEGERDDGTRSHRSTEELVERPI